MSTWWWQRTGRHFTDGWSVGHLTTLYQLMLLLSPTSQYFVFHVLCNRLIIQHLIQQLHNQQSCHYTMCLLHVSAPTWPSSERSITKEYNNGRFCWRCAYLESKIQCFQLKLLTLFKIQTNYKYFSYKYFTFHVNIYLSLQTDIFFLGKLCLCCR